MSTIEFTPDWPPGAGKVIVFGHDITSGIRGAVLRSKTGHKPELILDIAIDEVPVIYAEAAEIIIPAGARATLVDLGWAPPERVQQIEGLLRELVDDGPCHYDHHGQCQGHSLDDAPCPHARAKELLGALDETETS